MVSEAKLPIVIFAALVALIAIPFLIEHIHEIRRPKLLEARIVTATQSDPVFRNGRRRVPAGEAAEAALALRIGRRTSVGRWIAPVDRLFLDGIEIEHQKTGSWPEQGRALRVFWFSVECSNLGGRLTADNASERLRYRTFLAQEMGRGLRAEGLPEIHNDDHIGQQSMTAPSGAGTARLYARVEIVESDSDLRPLQAVTTQAVDRILDPGFPAILGSADLGDAIHDAAGELFGLPGFEPRSDAGAWNEVTVPAFGKPFTDLVAERFVVSSRTLAAVAVTGEPSFDEGALIDLGTLLVSIEAVRRRGRILRWQDDVRAGDLLVDGDHWWVLLGDDGNGELDPADTVLHSWGRPPERTTLYASLETDETTVEHMRHAQ
jgi:hypothetical protein